MLAIRPATRADIAALDQLMVEMDHFYGDTDTVSTPQRMTAIDRALFGAGNVAGVLLAWDGDELIGMASYSMLWPAAGTSTSLFLKELYVATGHRRTGAGAALMEAVGAAGQVAGCTRMEWQTEAGNTAARGFYAQLGAPVFDGKVFYRVQL